MRNERIFFGALIAFLLVLLVAQKLKLQSEMNALLNTCNKAIAQTHEAQEIAAEAQSIARAAHAELKKR